jgi:hypothetical protein
MSDNDGRVFSFIVKKDQLISLIYNSPLSNDLIIQVEKDEISATIKDEEHFLSNWGHFDYPGKIRLKKNDLLIYLEHNNIPENVHFFVGENSMTCINGNIDYGAIHVQSFYKPPIAEKITLLDDFLADEIFVLCHINLKHTYQKKLRRKGINHVIESAELDQIKQWYRDEVIQIVKTYMTDVIIIEGEFRNDIQFIIELPKNEIDIFKEECVEALLELLNEYVYSEYKPHS